VKFFYLEPEVAGGWGENTVFSRSPGKPTVVEKLHYEFHGWIGDEFLESTPCFIVSERMANSIKNAQLTGVDFDEVEVTKSEQFQQIYPNRELPKFLWIKISERAGHGDFGIAPDGRLVVSEKALLTLHEVEIPNALASEFS
jgi:hypothetical protein